jgi:hypothetical protein
VNEQDFIVKAFVHFKCGEGIRDRVTRSAARRGISVQGWLEDAVMRRINNGPSKRRVRTSARALLTNKRQIGVRLTPLVLGLLDADAEEHGVTRTVWLLDACLEYLAVRKGSG